MPEYSGGRVEAFTKDVVYKLLRIAPKARSLQEVYCHTFLKVNILISFTCFDVLYNIMCVVAKDYNWVADNIKYFFS